MSAVFAATYPDRTSAFILVGCYARRLRAPDYPWGDTREEGESFLEHIERGWGGPVGLARRAPSRADDPWFRQWWATYLRMSASPGAALALTRMNFEIDIRHVLPAIHVPTLIIHRTDDMAMPVEGSRYVAERIPGARYVELPGRDHLMFVGDQDAILDDVEEFLTGVRGVGDLDTVLTTVLRMEIGGSNEPGGGPLPASHPHVHEALVRQELHRFRGREVHTREGAFLATFDGPARAVRCARAISTAVRGLGLQVRAGVHTGECRVVDDRVEGAAVQTAAQIAALAAPGEILVSSTVKDLVAGSGIQLEERDTHLVHGGHDELRLFRLVQPGESGEAVPSMEAVHAERDAGPLSRREQEVVTLVALGLSNRQIADELTIAETTAQRHVANILNRLGYHSRAQIAVWMAERGLARKG